MRRALPIMLAGISDVCVTFAQPVDNQEAHWTFHFMNTVVQQGHNAFEVPYSGIKSLNNDSESQITVRNTWFIGKRLAKYTSFYLNPELAGGSGLSGVAGIAGFPNGEAFRVGSGQPKVYFARAYIRHHIPVSTETELVKNGVNQLEEELPIKRLTITAGKFSLLDYFDGSQFANDGRTQFMNWALMTGGAYDFSSDTRGNTWGIVLHHVTPLRDIKLATTVPSYAPNGPTFDFNLSKARSLDFDIRQKFNLFGKPATVGFTAYMNNTRGVRFDDQVYTQPDSVAKNRDKNQYHLKYGFIFNVEQQYKNWAWFTTNSWADGKTENYGFTQIDHSVSAGVVVFGHTWRQYESFVGLAGAINGLSFEQRNFLARGGNGFIIGDGKLSYGSEQIIEIYYSARISRNMFLTLDYQYISNIAFNRDRGGIGVWGIRSHIEL
ncbi:MAG: carbohydrate porin [Cyclobacteriaceae bacterium]|nr:carbohydrate porin [Cyclobacteriaceae bacterium]